MIKTHIHLIGKFTTPRWCVFLDDETRQIFLKTRKHIGKEVQQKHDERVRSYNSKPKTNKAHWVSLSYSVPQTHS